MKMRYIMVLCFLGLFIMGLMGCVSGGEVMVTPTEKPTRAPTQVTPALSSPTAVSSFTLESNPIGAPIVPNLTLIEARVLDISIVEMQISSSQDTVYLLELEVMSAQAGEGMLSFVQVGQVLEGYCKEDLAGMQAGNMLFAQVSLQGDERGESYWLTEVKYIKSTPVH
ncbi:MAG: hypothetical protein AB1345_06175 [Chloroflexota bacterium]